MKKPRISFYTTLRNGAEYFSEFAESIRAQDMGDWEAVLVDDGSWDESPRLLAMLAEQDSRFRVEISGGIGRGKALNRALKMCRSEIVANIDIDDLAHPSRARLALQSFEKNQEFDVIAGVSEVFSAENYPVWSEAPVDITKPVDVTSKLAYANPIGHSAVAMRRDSVLAIGGYAEDRVSQFDYDLWVRLAAAGSRIGRFPQLVAAKRVHSNQSFERNEHFVYAWRSAEVRWRAIQVLGASNWAGGFAILAHLAWAVVPRAIRMRARRVMQRS